MYLYVDGIAHGKINFFIYTTVNNIRNQQYRGDDRLQYIKN
jgi:hypothetical protein